MSLISLQVDYWQTRLSIINFKRVYVVVRIPEQLDLQS